MPQLLPRSRASKSNPSKAGPSNGKKGKEDRASPFYAPLLSADEAKPRLQYFLKQLGVTYGVGDCLKAAKEALQQGNPLKFLWCNACGRPILDGMTEGRRAAVPLLQLLQTRGSVPTCLPSQPHHGLGPNTPRRPTDDSSRTARYSTLSERIPPP